MVGYGRGVSGIPFRLGSMNGTPTINVALIPTLKDRYDTHRKGKRGIQQAISCIPSSVTRPGRRIFFVA